MRAYQQRGLSLVARAPLWSTDKYFEDQLGYQAGMLQAAWAAWGGYWSLTFRLTDQRSKIEGWLYRLGYDITLYSPGLAAIYNGFISEVGLNVGSLSLHRGPLLSTIANKIKVTYSYVDTSVTPPVVGGRNATTWSENAISQAKYGIIARNISVGGANETTAEQLRDTALATLKEPPPEETDNISGSDQFASVDITCLGYVHWLKAYTLALTTTGDQNANAKVQAIVAAEPNSLFSTNYTRIDTNATQVGAYDNDNRPAWSAMRGVVAVGDSSFNRWLFGLYADRKAVYNAIPTTTAYQRKLSDVEQHLLQYASQERVLPWEALPGQWVFYTDLLIGKTPPDTDRRLDPRYLFVEQSTFTLPWALTLQGSTIGRLDQLMASLGLGGTVA